MSTKVKIAIAAVIGTALVALIVLDQKSATPTDPSKPAATEPAAALPGGQAGEAVSLRDQVDELYQRAQKGIGTKSPSPLEDDKVRKGNAPPAGGKEVKPVLEEYTIRDGDN